MPEGPEIRRIRDQLAAFFNQKKVRIDFFIPALQSKSGVGRIQAVRSRGKSLLIQWNKKWIYVHLQLYGRWFLLNKDQWPQTKRKLRLIISTDHQHALLYSASTIELLQPSQLKNHPFLSSLGPDVLDCSTKQIRERLSLYPRRQLNRLLMQQSVLAGIGHYLSNEILFQARIHPKSCWQNIGAERQNALIKAIKILPKQSYQSNGITRDLKLAQNMIEKGASFEQARFWVFRRAGQACLSCQNSIIKQNGDYFCPHCQSG